MQFSPMQVTYSIVQPLRYFFSNATDSGLKWDKDPTLTQIDIGSINDLNKERLGLLPRILVDRGGFTVNEGLLSENMSEGAAPKETFGLANKIDHALISGQARIVIQAREEGAVEYITDMVRSFLSWTRHIIARNYGFKQFAAPMSVSPCVLVGEETEGFQVVIGVPYTAEERWAINQVEIKLKGIDFKIY